MQTLALTLNENGWYWSAVDGNYTKTAPRAYPKIEMAIKEGREWLDSRKIRNRRWTAADWFEHRKVKSVDLT